MYIDISRNIYENMLSQQFVLSMLGSLSHEMLCSIINVTEKKLNSLQAGTLSKKRIFHFMIECVENIHRFDTSNLNNQRNLLLIGKKENLYTVYIGCLCENTETTKIKQIIDEINQLDFTEVKSKFYSEMLSDLTYEKKPLLLSLLDITKRTKEKIGYEIIHLDNDESFLCFRTNISNS